MPALLKAPASPRPRYPVRRFAARCGLLAPVLAMVLALLAGCGREDTSNLALVVIGAPDDPFAAGPDRPLAGRLTRAATARGLVALDEQGRVVPALADRWIVTDDGESYIFRLREGEWRNGDALTARSAKAALDAAMRGVRGTPLGLDLSNVDEVRAMAGRVIEIRLFRPMPFFLQLLAQPELGLVHGKQGDGPMILDRRGAIARLTAIEPSRLGLPEVPDWEKRTRQLEMTALPAAQAVARFNDGAVDLVLGGRIQDFPHTSSVGILRGTIQLDPVIGLFGLHVANDKGFLADPQNREALAMAIDRPGLIAPFRVSGWSPSTRLLSAGLEGDLQTNGERWVDVPIEERRNVAAERVRRWLDREGGSRAGQKTGEEGPAAKAASVEPSTVATVSIWLPAGPGSDILFERLSSDFAAIGVTTKRAAELEGADLRLIDEVASYPRARWFLNRLSCVARHGLCDSQADAIVAGAVPLDDATQRATLLAEAEARLTEANLFIPFGTPIRWSLARGTVQGFATNPWSWHPLMPLASLPR